MSKTIYQFAADTPSPSWTDVSKESHDEYAARGGWLTRIVYAAPVVYRQQPVARCRKSPVKKYLSVELLRTDLEHGQMLYTSPPAPVAVVLPERMPDPEWNDFKPDSQAHEAACEGVSMWNACLDKVKELNQ